MSWELTANTDNLQCEWYNGATLVRTFYVNPEEVKQIISDVQTDSVSIILDDDTYRLKFKVSEVSSPTVANLAALTAFITGALSTSDGYSTTFTNASLVDGVTTFILTVTHNLGTINIASCVVYDPAGLSQVMSYTVVDADNITIDFGGVIGAGSWTVVVKSK
jgi:hypothetical protein